jgi:hypothetical protein
VARPANAPEHLRDCAQVPDHEQQRAGDREEGAPPVRSVPAPDYRLGADVVAGDQLLRQAEDAQLFARRRRRAQFEHVPAAALGLRGRLGDLVLERLRLPPRPERPEPE